MGRSPLTKRILYGVYPPKNGTEWRDRVNNDPNIMNIQKNIEEDRIPQGILS